MMMTMMMKMMKRMQSHRGKDVMSENENYIAKLTLRSGGESPLPGIRGSIEMRPARCLDKYTSIKYDIKCQLTISCVKGQKTNRQTIYLSAPIPSHPVLTMSVPDRHSGPISRSNRSNCPIVCLVTRLWSNSRAELLCHVLSCLVKTDIPDHGEITDNHLIVFRCHVLSCLVWSKQTYRITYNHLMVSTRERRASSITPLF